MGLRIWRESLIPSAVFVLERARSCGPVFISAFILVALSQSESRGTSFALAKVFARRVA
jgi:hypothetical protein